MENSESTNQLNNNTQEDNELYLDDLLKDIDNQESDSNLENQQDENIQLDNINKEEDQEEELLTDSIQQKNNHETSSENQLSNETVKNDSDEESTQNQESTSERTDIHDLNKIEAYDKIFSPFKAMGKQVTVKTPEEVISLMQKCIGLEARYNQVKPLLKISKILQQNDLFDENKLAELIDIKKGNKDALASFFKNNKIDPYDIDVEAESAKNYKPQIPQIDPIQIEFDNTVESIGSTPHGQQFLNTLANTYLNNDMESNQAIFRQPSLLYQLYDLASDGKLDQINEEFNRQKLISLTPIGYIRYVDEYLKQEAIKQRNISQLNDVNKVRNYQSPIGTKMEKQNPIKNTRTNLIPKMMPTKGVPQSTQPRVPLSSLTPQEMDELVNNFTPEQLDNYYRQYINKGFNIKSQLNNRF